jgi:hypothetical protein
MPSPSSISIDSRGYTQLKSTGLSELVLLCIFPIKITNTNYLPGVAYQLVPEDPLVDTTQCKLDAALMKTLGANAIRVYHVDPTADHTGCMAAFDDAGVYLFVDLDTFSTQIEQVSYGEVQSQDAFTDLQISPRRTGMRRSSRHLKKSWTSSRNLIIRQASWWAMKSSPQVYFVPIDTPQQPANLISR